MKYDKFDHDRDIYQLACDALMKPLPYLLIAVLVLGGVRIAAWLGWVTL